MTSLDCRLEHLSKCSKLSQPPLLGFVLRLTSQMCGPTLVHHAFIETSWVLRIFLCSSPVAKVISPIPNEVALHSFSIQLFSVFRVDMHIWRAPENSEVWQTDFLSCHYSWPSFDSVSEVIPVLLDSSASFLLRSSFSFGGRKSILLLAADSPIRSIFWYLLRYDEDDQITPLGLVSYDWLKYDRTQHSERWFPDSFLMEIRRKKVVKWQASGKLPSSNLWMEFSKAQEFGYSYILVEEFRPEAIASISYFQKVTPLTPP